MKPTKNTVLITGASSGIGLSCANKFAEAGARLVLIARRNERLKQLTGKLKDLFRTESMVIELDVRKREDVAKKLKELPQEWQEIDILINNAGLSRGLDKLHEGSI